MNKTSSRMGCQEETGQQVETQVLWFMLLLNGLGIEQIKHR